MSGLQLQVGKKYLTRKNEEVFIYGYTEKPDRNYPYKGYFTQTLAANCWNSNGQYTSFPDCKDLVKEVEETFVEQVRKIQGIKSLSELMQEQADKLLQYIEKKFEHRIKALEEALRREKFKTNTYEIVYITEGGFERTLLFEGESIKSLRRVLDGK